MKYVLRIDKATYNHFWLHKIMMTIAIMELHTTMHISATVATTG